MYHQPRNSLPPNFDQTKKKTLSLGLSSFQPSPVKNLAMATKKEPVQSDFDKYLERARHYRDAPEEGVFHPGDDFNPAVGSHEDHGHNYDHESNDYNDDYDPNEQYRYNQAAGEQQMDYNKFHRYPSPRGTQPKEKVLSVGVTSIVASPRDLNADDRQNRRERFTAYQKKLIADQEKVIEQSRKPFVRKNMEVDPRHAQTGLVIGADRGDKQKQLDAKRAAQMKYQDQLAADMRRGELDGGRKPFERRPLTPETQSPNQRNGLEKLGEQEALETERRRLAKQKQNSNRTELMNTMSSPPRPLQGQLEKQEGAHLNATEQQKFELASYKAIGEREADPQTARERKKAMQRMYMEQLLEDSGGQAPKHEQRNKGVYSDDVDGYIDQTGWTGLNIGGFSADQMIKGAGSRSPRGGGGGDSSPAAKMAQEKYLKQAAYKRLLDQQRMQAADISRMEAQKYGSY